MTDEKLAKNTPRSPFDNADAFSYTTHMTRRRTYTALLHLLTLAHINTLFSSSKLLLLVALLLLVGHALCERGLVCLLRLALRLDRLEFRLLNRRVNLLVL